MIFMERLNHRENLLRMIRKNGGGWIPFTLDIGAIPGFTQPVFRRFTSETGSERPDEYFDYDFRTFSLRGRFGGKNPRSLYDDLPEDTVFDEWGIGHWAGGAEGTYERMYAPFAGIDSPDRIDRHPVPVIEVPEDAKRIESYRSRGYPVFGYAGSIYEWSWWLRGMERFMEDLIIRPKLADTVVRLVSVYVEKLALKSAEAGIDVLCFYDDVGMQTGLQISPVLWRSFIKPRWVSIIKKVRSEYPGILFFLHSCGNVTEIVGDIVEAGFHILHPVQPECMDFGQVWERYGENIVLCGTVSAQRTFSFGSPDDVRQELRYYRELCGPDKRCILCPSNMIQPETPWENVLAFVEEARKERARNQG